MTKVNISRVGKFRLKFSASPVDNKVYSEIQRQFETKVTDKAVDVLLKVQPYATREAAIEGGSAFTHASPLGSGIQPFNNYLGARKLKRLYLKAWNKTYDYYRYVHSKVTPEQIYAKNPWVIHKRKNSGSPSPFLPSHKLKYKTHSLATGYLRQSIFDAFIKSGNQHLQVFNLLMKGGFSWDKSSYASVDQDYYEFIDLISSNFEDYGMYKRLGGNKDDIVNFFSSDWQEISKMMLRIFKDGPVEDIKKLLNEFTIEV
jgi:hypothetical protein